MKRFLFAIFTVLTVVATAQPKAVTWSTSIEHTEEFTLLTVHADIAPDGIYTVSILKMEVLSQHHFFWTVLLHLPQ